MSNKIKRPTLSILPFPDWLKLQTESDETCECDCCGGTGEVCLYDDYDHEYECECRECDGHGIVKPTPPTRRDWIREVRSEARKYRKFTGVIAKLQLAKKGASS